MILPLDLFELKNYFSSLRRDEKLDVINDHC